MRTEEQNQRIKTGVHLQADGNIRHDYELIASMCDDNIKLLDIACGDGDLLAYLESQHDISGQGIEISRDGVKNALSKGLSVIQGDADNDLDDMPDKAFDYAVLSQSVQALYRPRHVLEQMGRISKKQIVSFPNFGHWKVRWYLSTRGRMPVNPTLPWEWYNTPNIHFCTIKDFVILCGQLGFTIEQGYALNRHSKTKDITRSIGAANWQAEHAIFKLVS
ncbi:MAG: methionine biosynthesis protein MetW [Alphaproteobacteria bacterium]